MLKIRWTYTFWSNFKKNKVGYDVTSAYTSAMQAVGAGKQEYHSVFTTFKLKSPSSVNCWYNPSDSSDDDNDDVYVSFIEYSVSLKCCGIQMNRCLCFNELEHDLIEQRKFYFIILVVSAEHTHQHTYTHTISWCYDHKTILHWTRQHIHTHT